jgi:ribosomal 50S subunit-recycling heat shock protein
LSATQQARQDAAREDACRLDVWLWRARFFKSRGLAARFLEEGRVRLTRPGAQAVRIDKASRGVRTGDSLVFAIGGRLVAVQVQALGERRGPSDEARALYRDAAH